LTQIGLLQTWSGKKISPLFLPQVLVYSYIKWQCWFCR